MSAPGDVVPKSSDAEILDLFVAEGDYTDEAIERWSYKFKHLAEEIQEVALRRRLDKLEDEVGDEVVRAYLPPDPKGETMC